MKEVEKNEKIDSIIKEINDRFNQVNEPKLNEAYDFDDATVFFWECGGFILLDSMLYAFGEDDGWRFLYDNPYDYISSEWIPSLNKSLQAVNEYVTKM